MGPRSGLMTTSVKTATGGDENPKFQKAKPVGKRFGVCSKTISRWGDAGLISKHRVNARVVLYSVTEVESFITGGTQVAT